MGRFLYLVFGLVGLVALACGVSMGEREWMRDIDRASIECRAANYVDLLAQYPEGVPGVEDASRYGTMLTAAGEGCPITAASTDKRQFKTYAEHIECKAHAEEFYRQTFDNLGYESVNYTEQQQLEYRIGKIVIYNCYPEGNLEDLPDAADFPTSKPLPPTSTPIPTPTPTTIPTPTQVLSHRSIAEGYPFTIKVPADWSARVQTTDLSTEHHFAAPNNDFALVIVAISESAIGFPWDSEGLADISLREMERKAAEGSFELKERVTMPSGAVRFSTDYEVWPCPISGISLVQVLEEYAFAVEGIACQDEWDRHGNVLEDAVESFAPKPSGLP